jgi:hypothetical protein
MAISFVLLTPLLLASSPQQVTLPETTYNHTIQQQVGPSGDKVYFTGGGTQTFDYKGRPMDMDSD